MYNWFQSLLGGQSDRRLFVEQFIRPRPGDRVLDVLLVFLPGGVEYESFDMSADYIEADQKKYGSRGKFYCKQVTEESREPYDIIIASGLIHHLPDEEAMHLLRMSATALKPDGRLLRWIVALQRINPCWLGKLSCQTGGNSFASLKNMCRWPSRCFLM